MRRSTAQPPYPDAHATSDHAPLRRTASLLVGLTLALLPPSLHAQSDDPFAEDYGSDSQGEDHKTDEDDASQDDKDEAKDDEAKDEDAPPKADDPDDEEAYFQPSTARPETFRMQLGLGGLAASRSMIIFGDRDGFEHRPGVYLGGNASLLLLPWYLKDWSTDIGLLLQGNYAAGQNRTALAELGRTPITEHSLGSAILLVRHYLYRQLDLEARVGLQVTSFIVEPNDNYTGHRYTHLTLGAAARFWPNDSLSIGAHADAMPTLSINQSDGALGDGSGFGFGLGAELGLALIGDPKLPRRAKLALLASYNFQRFTASFPEPNFMGSQGAESQDAQNLFSIALRYSLGDR